jgi:hypothetical protein
MFDNEKLELAGPIGVIGAILSAELGAHALASWPTSSLLWYLNLEVFRGFQYSLSGLSIAVPWFETIDLTVLIAIPLIVLVCTGLMARIRLPLAIASNLSLIYSICLLYGGYLASEANATGDFTSSVLWRPSVLLAVAVLFVSLFSSTISHRRYWREIFP